MRSKSLHGIVCACWILLMMIHAAHGGTVLTLVVSDANPIYTNAALTGLLDRLALEAFARMGKTIHILRLPSQRALQMAQQGVVDGDLLRIPGLEHKYPALVMVPEPWLNVRHVAFTRHPDLRVTTWQDLLPWHVAFIKGWQVYETNLKKARTITRTDTNRQLFDLLDKKRVDVVLYDDLQGELIQREMGITQARIAGPPLIDSPVYAYLHHKHANLTSQLAAALRAMKQDGTWQKIHDSTFQGTP